MRDNLGDVIRGGIGLFLLASLLLVALILALAVVFAGLAVVGFLLALCLGIALTVAAAVISYCWLDRVRSQYEVPADAKWLCAVVGLVFFLLTVTIRFGQGSSRISSLWLALAVGILLAVASLNLVLYKRTFWPHRQAILLAEKQVLPIRARVWKAECKIKAHQLRLTQFACGHADIFGSHENLEFTIDETVHRDPALYSAEKCRLSRECERMSVAEIETRLRAVHEALERTRANDPLRDTLALQSAVIRQEGRNRILGNNLIRYQETQQRIYRIHEEVKGLRSTVQLSAEVKQAERDMIATLRESLIAAR